MDNRLEEFARRSGMLPERGGSILAAVSGGADSVCMLFMLKETGDRLGFTVEAATFDHRLRGEESARDALFTAKLCDEHGIRCTSGSGDVSGWASAHGVGSEEAARELRYAFLRKTARERGIARIATAHTADDNAETVIMNLVRGAGARGLSGIPPIRGDIVRPMLWASREDVMEYLQRNGLPHVEDSTNALDLYTRNKLRHNVIPLLRQLNPRFSAAAADTAQLLRADDSYLTELAEEFIENNRRGRALPSASLAKLPYAVSSRAIRLMTGREISKKHVDSVLSLCGGGVSARISLPGLTVRREYELLVFGEAGGAELETTPLEVGKTVSLPAAGLAVTCSEGVMQPIINKSLTTFLFKKSSVCGTIVARSRKSGDAMRINQRSGTKSLKKLFIEKHIPRDSRDRIPVLADRRGVLAVCGLGTDVRAAAEAGDDIIIVKFEEEQEA